MDISKQYMPIERLKTRPEFLAVRKGSKRRGKYFMLEVLDRKSPDTPARVGFTVTKKQGNAVIRNRIRRRLREAVRIFAFQFMRPGHDYVIVGHNDMLKAKFSDIANVLQQMLEATDNVKKPGYKKHKGKA